MIDAIEFLLFVFSAGGFFRERFSKNWFAYVLAVLVAMFSTVYLGLVIVHSFQHAPDVPSTMAVPATHSGAGPSVSAIVLRSAFDTTRDILDWSISAGTGGRVHAVSEETVLQVLVGVAISLVFALLGLIVRIGSKIVRVISS